MKISSTPGSRPLPARPLETPPTALEKAPEASDVVDLRPASAPRVAEQAQQQQALARLVVAPALDPLTRQVLMGDLGRFPAPWLSFLGDYGVQVVVMKDGQTLADSPAMARSAVADLPAHIESTRSTLAQAFQAVGPDELAEGLLRQQLKESVQDWLLQSGSPFRLAVHRQPIDLDDLARRRHVPEPFQESWKQSWQELNGPWVSQQEGKWDSLHGLVLLPPIPTEQGSLPDAVFQSARETTAEHVAQSLGLNRGPEQMVLLHERYLPNGAPEIGDYRVAIHEVGHALDYALEGLPDETGFGQVHKERLRSWFERDMKKGPEAFTSDRARDDVREYFAEAVEAYLTTPSANDFRPDNHRERLRQLNPELFEYLRQTLESQPQADWKSRPPQPATLPPGFPDPDRDPLELD